MNILIEFEKKPLLFTRPAATVCCTSPRLLADSLKEVERFLRAGYYVAGFLSYEAGYCFEERLYEGKEYSFPLLLMGAYRKPAFRRFPPEQEDGAAVHDISLNITRPDYARNIGRIRSYINAGDVYQITYCIKLAFTFRGSTRALYASLLHNQPVPYPAYIETEEFKILSLSPERFFKKEGGRVITEPMKGTWPRGQNLFSDILARIRFSSDAKNKAENVMIADLLRNDMGKIGNVVRAPKLFTVTGYQTLYQMTSTVTGAVPRGIALYDLFAALFPSGSVTGAPKIRAMEIIKELEPEERKIYTGALGYISPDRDMYFNIPIRTLLISGQSGEMGIGGGIVWDSTAQGEWDEGLLKARFLTDYCTVT
jgi:para-aminobenzoate synthetase/4-amino-4-deoxychorismate lyase